MVAIKAHQATGFLRAPDPRLSVVLLYGTDAGLVAERGARLAQYMAERQSPPGEILRFDDSDVEADPSRLAVELQTLPMFGGRKVIRAAAGRRINASLLKPLIEGEALAGFLIVEADNLRPDDSLRALCEKAGSAAAVACYPDEAKDLDAVVSEELARANKEIAPETRQLLLSRLGADRILSRGELEKLVLYVGDKKVIGADDVEAIVGDASELALDKIILAVAMGQGARALTECDRAVASGESPQTIIAATQRYFHRLHRIRTAIDGGRSLDDALRQLRPPLPFKQQDAFARACRMWSSDRLTRAISGLAEAAKAARLAGTLEQALAERLLLNLARLARAEAP